MELYGQKSKSWLQKIVIHLIELFLLWLSYWILFKQGSKWLQTHWNIYDAAANTNRRIVIFSFNIITFLRFAYMMFFLLKRKIPWEECVSVPFAFVLYFIGFSLLVLPTTTKIDAVDYFGIFIFVVGCVLNTGGEVLRDQWKKDSDNQGKLYTEGFFKYARHINYFGDLLWVTGYAIITRNWYSIGIPVFLFCFFAFYNAPKLDAYLKEKYNSEYDRYAKKTKMLIPFIY